MKLDRLGVPSAALDEAAYHPIRRLADMLHLLQLGKRSNPALQQPLNSNHSMLITALARAKRKLEEEGARLQKELSQFSLMLMDRRSK
jgi:hypothetical protein